MTATNGRVSIAVLGGGFAGLESAFLPRAELGDRAAITLVSDRDRFLFKPNTIYIPFGREPHSLLIPLFRPARGRDIALVRGVRPVHRAHVRSNRSCSPFRPGTSAPARSTSLL